MAYSISGEELVEQALTTISPKLSGFLDSDDGVYSYQIVSNSFNDKLEGRTSARYISDIIRELDESRGDIYQHRYGTTVWTGAFFEDELDLAAEYASVSSSNDLPGRHRFLDTEISENDPHDILSEPLQFKIRGKPSMRRETVLETL